MDLATRLTELAIRTQQHREILLTEEAAKTALVMPFIQALGYDVFNPSEVVPEFTADVGTKKGEKVDYAICCGNKITILIECKPSAADLNLKHASQLFRYFSVTDARLAILTNGVVYKFYSDIDQPNKMDANPFFTFSMEQIRKTDIRIIEQFCKSAFDIDRIVQEAGNLKLESMIRTELEKEMSQPSDDLIKIVAGRVYTGRATAAVKENLQRLIINSFATLIRDQVNERLTSALNAAAVPTDDEARDAFSDNGGEDTLITTQEEISGFRIIQAIAAKSLDPKRIVMRDAKSYCAILLDDNNRKAIARLWFNGISTKYVGSFSGKEEQKHAITDLTDIYMLSDLIEARLKELES